MFSHRPEDLKAERANPMRLSTCVAGTAIAALLVLPAATNTTAAAMPWCGADSLDLSTTPPIYPTPEPFIYLSILLTNVSEETCSLQGYPGVDLVGPTDPHVGVPPAPDDPPFDGIVSASRTGGDAQPVVLAPGATASSRLGFQPRTSSTGLEPAWPPDTIVVTPPDATTQLQTPWPPGGFSVQLINDGTYPVVTIEPLQPYA
jgi:hypothetical protein